MGRRRVFDSFNMKNSRSDRIYRVFQLELLEFQETGDLTPYGVVLALVGPEVEITSPKEHDAIRSIRMYSLASLVSLARWAIMMKVSSRTPSAGPVLMLDCHLGNW